MPIIIKDFSWKQTRDRVSIKVPLNGVPPNKVDIFTSPQYLKATYGSYFFEVLLLNSIDVAQSNCTKTSTCILFDLMKYSEGDWDSLEIENISKEEKNVLRMKLIQEEHERIQKLSQEKINKKAELKREYDLMKEPPLITVALPRHLIMPIIIKDFSWKQTRDRVSIKVPLNGVPPNKVDIFTSPQYLKATYGSYFFEVLLLNSIDVAQSNCTKTSTCILFDLMKYSEGDWDSLEIENISKEEKNVLRMKLIQEEHERIQKLSQEKINKKAELKRVAINEQIQLDTKVRNQIEEIKKTEENIALGDLNEWKKNIETCPRVQPKLLEIEDDEDDNEMINPLPIRINPAKPVIKDIRTISKSNSTKQKEVSKSVSLPKPRSIRSLQVLFTPREFPTPSRESRLAEENEFLSKQAAARRSVGFVSDDLRPEEKNPQYLLAKGREFLKNQNYLGAVSAFSFGIKLSPKFVDLYLARSEAQVMLGNFKRAVDDCTDALNLLRPLLPINLHDRAICLGRRGIALFKLGFLKQGISELEASIKLEKSLEFQSILEECRLELEDIESNKKADADRNEDRNKEETR